MEVRFPIYLICSWIYDFAKDNGHIGTRNRDELWCRKCLLHFEVKQKYYMLHNIVVVLFFMKGFISERLCLVIIIFSRVDLDFLEDC